MPYVASRRKFCDDAVKVGKAAVILALAAPVLSLYTPSVGAAEVVSPSSVVPARYSSTRRPLIEIKSFKDKSGNPKSYSIDDFDGSELWDSVNTYGNVSREVLNKKAPLEGIVKVGVDCERKKIDWLVEDFNSEQLMPMVRNGSCYGFNFTYDPFHLMGDDVSDQFWSLAIMWDGSKWSNCLAYGNKSSGVFPDPYPCLVRDVVYKVKFDKSENCAKKHAILVLEQDLVDKHQALPLEDKGQMPALCFNEYPLIGADIRAILNRVNATRTEGDLVLPLLNTIPDKNSTWPTDYWPQDITVPKEWADLKLDELACKILTTTTATTPEVSETVTATPQTSETATATSQLSQNTSATQTLQTPVAACPGPTSICIDDRIVYAAGGAVVATAALGTVYVVNKHRKKSNPPTTPTAPPQS